MDSDPGPFKLGQHGGKRLKGQRNANGTLKRGSNSVDYIIARLERDAREGCREAGVLLNGIRSGKISAYAAGCEMNYTRRREPNGRGSENMTKRRDWALHKLLNPRSVLKAQEKTPNAAASSSVEGKSG